MVSMLVERQVGSSSSWWAIPVHLVGLTYIEIDMAWGDGFVAFFTRCWLY